MRWLNWRRAVALVAIVVGIGAGATTPAAAAGHTQATHPHASSLISPNDFWWN
jgi:hypothetical protein